MSFWAYLLRRGDGSYYAGHTDNLQSRVGQHVLGRGCEYTAQRQPVAFAWAQDFASRIEALEAERRIKGWSRAKKEALIADDWERVSRLAVSYAARASTSSARTVGGGATDPAPVPDLRQPVLPEPVEGRAPRGTPAP